MVKKVQYTLMDLDEFRIQFKQQGHFLRDKVRRYFVKILKRWLSKLDQWELKKCTIDKTTSVTITKFVNDDKKWHHHAFTVDFWIRFNKKTKREKTRTKLAVDGKEKFNRLNKVTKKVKK